MRSARHFVLSRSQTRPTVMSAERNRPPSRSRSPSTSRPSPPDLERSPSFDVGETTLDIDDVSDHEIDALHFEDDTTDEDGFLNLPTITGLSLIVFGIVYLLTELGVWSGPDPSALVNALPFVGGVLVILLGFGLMNRRSSKKDASPSIASSPSEDASSTQTDSEESSSVFDKLTSGNKRLRRSRSEKKLMGVCGGLAEYFSLDPTLVRIGFVLGTIASGGPFVIAYLALAFVMPKEPKRT